MYKNHAFIFVTTVCGSALCLGQLRLAAYIDIAPGEYKTGSLAPGEMHTYRFTASAGDSVTILMSQSSHVYDYGETFEPHVELLAPDGTVLAVNSGPDSATIQAVRIPQRGTCFIVAREKDGFDAGDYGLSLVKNPGTVMVNDPNGGSINPGEYKKGRIEAGDIDAYTFVASAGDSVTILMGQSSRAYDYGEVFEPHVELHGPDGTVLATNSGSDSATIQSVKVPQGGTCFILAREKDGFDVGDYGLSLVKIPGTVTVNDPNGGSIHPGEYKKGRIEPGDIDAYTFAASAGDSVTILMSQSSHAYDYGETFEPRIELYAPDGTLVDANSGPDSATIHSVRMPQKGVCFIIAREKDGSDVGDYGLSLLKVPGTANCATIEPGEYKRGRIEPGEMDVYAFTASAGDSMTILTSQIGTAYGEAFEPRVELHAPDGTVLATSSGPQSATIQSVRGPQCGTYYVAVRDADGLDAGDYGLSLSGRITPGICGDFNEVSFSEATLVETIYTEQWAVGTGNVVGDVNGVFALNEFELVTIGTGSWTGKGFSRALCEATFEGATYMGEWQGIAFFDRNATEIRLKGSIDGEILATVEGTLTESIPGSGAYDQYQATWKIGRLDNTTTSATVSASGILINQNRIEYPSTGLYVLQTAMDGNLAGDLSGPLNAVVNHVRVADANNPYNGCGFSIISYVCQSGSGEGYTCDGPDSSGMLMMKGMFTDPLFSVLSATLNETTTPRGLHLTLQRIDLGLPPMADLEVATWGPERVSPGQTVNLMVEYRNQGLSNAYDTVVVAQLPPEVNYVSGTNGGIYRWETHEVIWKLGTIPPKTKGMLSTTTQIQWGLPWGSRLRIRAMIGTTGAEIDAYLNAVLPLGDVMEYLSYEPQGPPSGEILIGDPSEIGLLLQEPPFSQLYQYSEQLGFDPGNVVLNINYADGGQLKGVLMVSPTTKEFLLVLRFTGLDQGNAFFVIRLDDNNVTSLFNEEGGIRFLPDATMDVWGRHQSCSFWSCEANCLLNKLPPYLFAKLLADLPEWVSCVWSVVKTVPACASYWTALPQDTNRSKYHDECLASFASAASSCGKKIPWASETIAIWTCTFECLGNQYSNPGFFMCVPGATRGRCSGLLRYLVTYECDPDCHWKFLSKQDCEKDCAGAWCYEDVKAGTAHCVIPRDCDDTPPNTDSNSPTVTPARDPNRKIGPQGNVLPGQRLDYKVEYENEGEGIAFGVYLTDTLDEDVNDSTLEIGPVVDIATGVQIAPPGHYNRATRTISWFVGQVNPNQGGYAEINVDAKSDAADGTEIINYATVYFPSVPEATRTNAIVSIVSTVPPCHPPVVDAGAEVTLNEGKPLSRIGSFVDGDAGDSWLASVEYGDGSGPQALELDGKTYTLHHTYADEGVYQVTVTVTDSCGEFGTGRFVVTVKNPVPVVSASIQSQHVQYSDSIDEVVFTATGVSADTTMHASVSYSADGGKTFATKMTTPPMLVPPDDKTIAGGLGFSGDIVQVGSATWTLSGVADLGPGTYIIRLAVSDEDGASASVDTTINVMQEDAFATYVGSESVSTASATDSVATVELWALIQDITAVNPASDSDAGNITKASVTFVNRDTGVVIAEGIRVMLLDPEDPTVGLARYEWLVDIGSQNSASFTVGMIVEGYYTRDSSADNTIVTVSRPGM